MPDNLGALAPLHEAGVFGFKCFLSPSGVEEFPHLDRAQMLAAMEEIAALGSRLIVHAEDPAFLGEEGALGRGYEAFLASRPPASEASAIDAVIDGARRTGARAHILHLSDAHSLPAIRAAKAEGVALTVETCPHYLTIVAEEIPDGASEFKCCPPIRESANRDLLWEGIVDGTIDAIVSDHSPSTVDLKRSGGGDFGLAWGGIAGLQVGLSAVWTEARGRGIPLETILPLFTTGPAAVAGLTGAGVIEPGAPAHLTVFGVDDPLRDRRRTAAAQEPDHRLRPPRAERQDPPHLAARQVDVQRDRGRRGRSPALPRQAARPAAVGARDRRGRDADGTRARNPDAVGWGHADRRWRSCSPAAATSRATHYLRSTPETVMWGRLPCEADAAVLTHRGRVSR